MSDNKKQDNLEVLEQVKAKVAKSQAPADNGEADSNVKSNALKIIDEIEAFTRDFEGDKNVRDAWLHQRFNDLRAAV